MSKEPMIYWTLFTRNDWSLYTAATSKGLCFIGSNHGSFEELEQWAKNHCRNTDWHVMMKSWRLTRQSCPSTLKMADQLFSAGGSLRNRISACCMESAYGHTVRRDILLFGYSKNDSETGDRKSRGRCDWKKSGIDYGSVPSRHRKKRETDRIQRRFRNEKQLLALEGGNIETLEYRLSRTGGIT